MAVQAGLCQSWSETLKIGFLVIVKNNSNTVEQVSNLYETRLKQSNLDIIKLNIHYSIKRQLKGNINGEIADIIGCCTKKCHFYDSSSLTN